MFSQFFIQRPVFASVIAIVIVIAGLVSMTSLPIEQYPEISPPTVKVTARYPGANAEVVSDTVATVIEQQVNGVEGMLYMSSTCASDGSYSLTVTFEVGVDMDMATVLVQNRVAIAEAMLPEEVKRQGVTTKKQSTNIVLFLCLTSPDGRFDDIYLSNYASLRIKDELARIEGVGEVQIYGADYSMRIWLDPERLKARNLTTNDVVSAIREQNVQVAAGQIGQPPVPEGQNFQYTINTLGRLSDVEQFENIIVKTGEGGGITRVVDVADVELGAKQYDRYGQRSGKPAAAFAVYQLPGANALDVADKARAKMAELARAFPEGLTYHIPLDTTTFVRASIREVVVTLFQAVALVFLVIFVFLQDWRSTLIPAVTIPVSLVGTFAVMAGLGFSINMFSLFGLVLAIGIVVDDAIVVVENVSRNIDEVGLPPKDAAIKAMREVSGPVIATTLVLLAVFVPTAFMGGITGRLYKQFALTISASTVISSLNALTLSPALCAILLRPSPGRRNVFFRGFNWVLGKTSNGYQGLVGAMVRRAALMVLPFIAFVVLAGWGFASLPTGFLPTEDQGYAMATVQLPDAASVQRTHEVVERVNAVLVETDGVEDYMTVVGHALMDSAVASNAAAFWVIFEPFEERTEPSLQQDVIMAKVQRELSEIQEAVAFTFLPPAIPGLGVAGGFQMQLQDRGDIGLGALQQVATEMAYDGNAQAGLTGVYTTFRATVPQRFIDVNRTKVKTLGIPLSAVFDTMQAYLGSAYVNDFNKFGRTYQVMIQAEPRFRARASDIRTLEVRDNQGEMIPLSTVATVEETLGPQIITRYNLYPSASINGAAAPGYSSGQALTMMEQMARSKLPSSMGFEWTGMSYQEKLVGGEAVFIFALAVLFVYLVLAAQYESWNTPISVILSVPFALLGAVVAVMVRGMDNNVYTQIGVVLLIALASKNAILIVEFAREIRSQGKSRIEAAIEAARLRFRPILMTAFSSIFGFFPLVVASGAGAASRQALGTAVVGGLAVATVLGLIFVPVLFVVVQWVADLRSGRSSLGPPPTRQGPTAG